MRRFPVDLTAAGYVAAVDVLLPQMHAGRAEPLGLLTIGTVAGRAPCVPSLGAGRGRLADAARPHAHATAAPLGATGTGARARRRGRVMVEAESGRPPRQHRFVRVLEEIVAGGGRGGQQMIAGQGKAGRVVGRVVGHLGGVDTDADCSADVEPPAGCRGPVHVPPTVARFNPAVSRAGHRVERPRLVRVPAVNRAQRSSLHLTEQAALMMVRIAGRLGARRPREVQVAAVLGRGRRARRDRRSRVATARASGAARSRRSLTHSRRRASSSSSSSSTTPSSSSASSPSSSSSAPGGVLGRAAAALRALLPRVEPFAHRRVRERWRALAAQFVALGCEHRQRCTPQTRMILQRERTRRLHYDGSRRERERDR